MCTKISSKIWQWKNCKSIYICRSYDRKSKCIVFLTHSVYAYIGWRFGVVVTRWSRSTRLNLRWARPVSIGMGDRVRVPGFDSRRKQLISVCNQPPRLTQHSTLRGMVKWVPELCLAFKPISKSLCATIYSMQYFYVRFHNKYILKQNDQLGMTVYTVN